MYIGIVNKGHQNGRLFGFPTVNIKLDDATHTFEKGVFATKVSIKQRHYFGMLYIGVRPTLNLKELSIEIHILDFDEEVYGEALSFTIEKKIREEIRFENKEALIAQLKKDRDVILEYFHLS